MELSLIFYIVFFIIVLFTSVYLYLSKVPKVNEVSCKDFKNLILECSNKKENITNIFLIENCENYKPGHYDILYLNSKCIPIYK